MLSINTNLSSLIAQNSMKSSTNKLNQAIERMTTGSKINHAKDNAANYSISTNMTTQLNAYEVAADNVAMGMDLVTTANDIISNMQDKAERLRALCTQSRNGTYGAQSMQAINSEAAAIMAEINRLYSTAEYNNISLFNRKAYTIADHLPKAGASGFIDETGLIAVASTDAEHGKFLENPVTYTDEQIEAMLANGDIVALDNNVTSFTSGQKYLISDKSELERLATLVNSGKNSTGAIFILGADIDLQGEEWTPIGNYEGNNSSKIFKGTFDGNGHVIKNLTIDNETKNYQGLFGHAYSGSEIKNIGLEGGSVKGAGNVGGLVGYARSSSSISNSYATGNVTGSSYVGGLVGYASSSISNSYATGNVTGSSGVGGLVGCASSSISNSYATGNVTGSSNNVGGLVGYALSSSISNSYATGNVTGSSNNVGGLVGYALSSSSISNSYATGNVTGDSDVGGLVGYALSSSISNSYATGNVTGTNFVGGILGQAYCSDYIVEINDSISYSTVNGSIAVGSLVGGVVGIYQYIWNYGDGDEGVGENSDGELLLTNCSAIANNDYIGGYYKHIANDIDYEDPDTGDWIENYDMYYELDTTFDLSVYNANITAVELRNIMTNLQVGIYNNTSCQINFDTNFDLDLSAIVTDISSDLALATIDSFITQLSEQETKLGAVQNRLESALESIEVNINNLTSSRSTIRDADIAEVSSEYIQQQILQQASATLMSTANQSPSIALQLI